MRVDGAGGSDAGTGVFGLHGAAARRRGTGVGHGKPGEKVTVEFAGQTKRTVAGEDGRWRVRLDAINDTTVTGGLKVTGENILLVKGVLVGEVWFASGQSNMAMTVSRCRDFEKEQAAAKFPHIRMFITEPLAAAPAADGVHRQVVDLFSGNSRELFRHGVFLCARAA